jgi:hypothetical protein
MDIYRIAPHSILTLPFLLLWGIYWAKASSYWIIQGPMPFTSTTKPKYRTASSFHLTHSEYVNSYVRRNDGAA